jgi:hypothetical protein
MQMTTRRETQRIIELLDQGIAAGHRKEDIVRRIAKEMAHLRAADVIQVLQVRREERRCDRAETQVIDIMEETQRMSGRSLTLAETFVILSCYEQRGDKRASKLLDDLSKAARICGLGGAGAA